MCKSTTFEKCFFLLWMISIIKVHERNIGLFEMNSLKTATNILLGSKWKIRTS